MKLGGMHIVEKYYSLNHANFFFGKSKKRLKLIPECQFKYGAVLSAI
jgi:hypothetical protein